VTDSGVLTCKSVSRPDTAELAFRGAQLVIWPRHYSFIKAVITLLVIVVLGGSLTAQDGITIPGTTLKIGLPSGWRVGQSPTGLPGSDVLWHDQAPPYAVQVSERKTGSTADRRLLPLSTCGVGLGAILSTKAGTSAYRIPRPSVFPESFYGTVLEVPDKLLVGCLNAGNRILVAIVFLAVGSPSPQSLGPLLTAISDAAFADQQTTGPPGSLHLKLFDIDVPVPAGKWVAQESTEVWGSGDVVVRLLGTTELTITPFIFSRPGTCSALQFDDPSVPANIEKSPGYTGSSWVPIAHEIIFPPGMYVEAFVCREIAPGTALAAKIMQEGTVIRAADYGVISLLLDTIANAVEQKLARSPGVALPGSQPSFGVLGGIMPQTSVAQPVTQVPPLYPPLAKAARVQGVVILQALIGKDGSVESLEVISGHPMLIGAAMDAVKQWRYKPTFVNGSPVQLRTTVKVTFTLDDKPQNPK